MNMDKSKISILGAIVTYNPNITRLKECISSIAGSVDKLLVIDNASLNRRELIDLISDMSFSVSIICNDSNEGIAKALKRIMDIAVKEKADWVITLDQDSIALENLVEEYKKYISDNVGAMTCVITDRNYGLSDNRIDIMEEINDCITSGCFMQVDAYTKTDGYDEQLFIDYVDVDICYSLKEKGFQIIRIPFEGLLHEYGHDSQKKRFGFKVILVSNHNAIRKYYMARNKIILKKKHPDFFSLYKLVIYEIGLIVRTLYEDNRLKKVCHIIKGIVDGICY